MALSYYETMSEPSSDDNVDAGYTEQRFDALLELLNKAPALEEDDIPPNIHRGKRDDSSLRFEFRDKYSALDAEARCWVLDQIYHRLYKTVDLDSYDKNGYGQDSVDALNRGAAGNDLVFTKRRYIDQIQADENTVAQAIARNPPGALKAS